MSEWEPGFLLKDNLYPLDTPSSTTPDARLEVGTEIYLRYISNVHHTITETKRRCSEVQSTDHQLAVEPNHRIYLPHWERGSSQPPTIALWHVCWSTRSNIPSNPRQTHDQFGDQLGYHHSQSFIWHSKSPCTQHPTLAFPPRLSSSPPSFEHKIIALKIQQEKDYDTLVVRSSLVELNGNELTVHTTISAHIVSCIRAELKHIDDRLN